MSLILFQAKILYLPLVILRVSPCMTVESPAQNATLYDYEHNSFFFIFLDIYRDFTSSSAFLFTNLQKSSSLKLNYFGHFPRRRCVPRLEGVFRRPGRAIVQGRGRCRRQSRANWGASRRNVPMLQFLVSQHFCSPGRTFSSRFPQRTLG